MGLHTLKVDPGRRTVDLDGDRIHTTEVEFGVLLTLARENGSVVTKEQMLREVWTVDEKDVQTRTVDVTVSRLRRKFGPDAKYVILTVHGIGWKLGRDVSVFVASLRGVDAATEQLIQAKRQLEETLDDVAFALHYAADQIERTNG